MPQIDTTDSRLDYAKVTITVDGKEFFAKSVSYGDSLEFSDVEGNSQISRGTTAGVYKTEEGTLELYIEEFAELMGHFKGNKFYETKFTITVAYAASGNAGMKADELHECRFTKRSGNYQGSEALTRSVGFKPRYIRFNGHDPLGSMPEGAKTVSADKE